MRIQSLLPALSAFFIISCGCSSKDGGKQEPTLEPEPSVEEPQYEFIDGVVVPNENQIAWADAEIGVIIHLDMQVFKPGYDWEKFGTHPSANIFNPTLLDTDQWLQAAQSLGAKYAVLVAKHCSGFSLWPTKAHSYSVASSPWRDGKGDIVADFIASCQKFGIKPGIYASAQANGYLHVAQPGRPAASSKITQNEYNAIVEQQLTELWTQYGDLFEIWFDGGIIPTSQGGPDLLPLLMEYQPNAIVFQGPMGFPNLLRWIGNESGNAPWACWATAPSTTNSSGEAVIDDYSGDPNAPYWCPGEADFPLRLNSSYLAGWFWHEGQDSQIFPTDQLLKKYESSVGRNTNMLVGMVIDKRGLVPDADVERFAQFGNAIRQKYGTPYAVTSGTGEKITLTFDHPVTIDHLYIQENIRYGERVLQWHIDGLIPGKGGKRLASGSCVGHKKIVNFAPETVTEISFVVDKAKGMPIIRELAVFEEQ